MIDGQLLRDEPERVRDAFAARNMEDVDIDRALDVYDEWHSLKAEGDDLCHERNEVGQQIGQLKQEGKDEEAQETIDHSGEFKGELQELETRANELEAELDEVLMELPNLPYELVPVGADEDDNKEVRRVGFDDLRELPDEMTSHYDFDGGLDAIDEGCAAKTAGLGFYFLKGEGAMFEHTLVQFIFDVRREQEYVDLFPLIPVKTISMEGTGQLPKFVEDAYRIGGAETENYDDDDLWLCPTAEVPMTNMYRDEILLKDDLPLKHQAYTPNLRREAGEHGTETRDIVYVHRFNKAELVSFIEPDESYDRLEAFVDEAAEVLDRLGLLYRVLSLCTGDLTFAPVKTHGLEVWAPGMESEDALEQGSRWLEVSSVPNFEDFQACRVDLRHRPERHESAEYLHTLNASGTAADRVMVALLKYYQNGDGTVDVPEPLQLCMGGCEVIEGYEPVGEATVGVSKKD